MLASSTKSASTSRRSSSCRETSGSSSRGSERASARREVDHPPGREVRRALPLPPGDPGPQEQAVRSAEERRGDSQDQAARPTLDGDRMARQGPSLVEDRPAATPETELQLGHRDEGTVGAVAEEEEGAPDRPRLGVVQRQSNLNPIARAAHLQAAGLVLRQLALDLTRDLGRTRKGQEVPLAGAPLAA